MSDINELYNRMMKSKERKIKFNLWMFKNNVSICDGNFRDLNQFYSRLNEKRFIKELREKTDYQKNIELINLDMLRRISNYLSSAFTLVGYARNYMEDNYSNTEIILKYREQVQEKFVKYSLTAFIQNLRNYFLHNGISGFSYGFHADIFSNDDNVIRFVTILQRRDLLKGDYFKSAGRTYLSQLPEQIDIMEELKKYHLIIEDFYKWLFRYLEEIHREDINKAKIYEREYFAELYRISHKM